MGTQGSVIWQFKERGVMRITGEVLEGSLPRDEVSLRAIDIGAQDVREEDGDLIIYTAKEDLQTIKEVLGQFNILVEYAEVEWVSDCTIEVSEADRGKLERLFEALDELEDVTDYYHNAQL